MIKNYLLMAFRNLKKYKVYSFINILGLAVGLSAFILILLYLQFELSYDKFHQDADQIYRVGIKSYQEGKYSNESYVFTPPIGEEMKKEFPEVEEFVRMSTLRPAYLNINNEAHKETSMRYASDKIFEMFSFDLIQGDEATALTDPFSIVLSRKTAERLFGSKDPMGKTVQIGPEHLYQITGVVENPPENSSIQFTALISFSTLYTLPNLYLGWNGGNQYITYVKLNEGTSPGELEKKLPDFMWRHINERIASYGWKNEAYFQPLKKLHFHYDPGSRMALTNFYTFTVVAVFILLIAGINFVNLTTARAARRAREVGLRKVVGANRGNLIRQFLGESVFLTFLAFLLGASLVSLFTPLYSRLLNKDLNVLAMINPLSVLALIGLILVVGIAAGIYPAFYLSAFQPVKTVRGEAETGRGRKKFRDFLVVFQFAISVTLIICTVLVQNQIRFIKKAELGYEKENMLVINLPGQELGTKTEEMREKLLSIPGITHVSASSQVPYRGFTRNGYVPEGYASSLMFHALDIDEHFFDAYGIEVIKGRNFNKEFSTDKEAYLINETLAKQLGWENPVGKTISRNGEWKVIGVVKDFQFSTLHHDVGSLIITRNPWENRFDYLSVKLNTNDLPRTVQEIKKVYKEFSPLLPFEYFFLDQAFDRVYKSEERFQKIFLYFSILAICIALLGLFSLTAFTAQQKAKEIGIRKVLGATVPSILSMFVKDMMLLIGLANLIAWPAAYYVIQKFLQNYAYREDVSLWAFVLALFGSAVAALATISYQSFRAAFKNPADVLRTE
ncbi:MAG: FtsX-like permease family protein [Candidatus Aminicenantes bacterium]|nr:FtsX-like permease family protein [Candidatus Aminicenantes bacterium]